MFLKQSRTTFVITDCIKRKDNPIETTTLINIARQSLEDKKGEHIVVLDVRKLSSVTDYYVICSGMNSRHYRALADACEKALIAGGRKPHRISGTPESAWMILDYLDVVVHVFGEEARKHYALETLWKDAPRIR